jgi:hypothetical protein
MELDDMERLVLEKGVVQKVPPTPAAAIPKRQYLSGIMTAPPATVLKHLGAGIRVPRRVCLQECM